MSQGYEYGLNGEVRRRFTADRSLEVDGYMLGHAWHSAEWRCDSCNKTWVLTFPEGTRRVRWPHCGCFNETEQDQGVKA